MTMTLIERSTQNSSFSRFVFGRAIAFVIGWETYNKDTRAEILIREIVCEAIR